MPRLILSDDGKNSYMELPAHETMKNPVGSFSFFRALADNFRLTRVQESGSCLLEGIWEGIF